MGVSTSPPSNKPAPARYKTTNWKQYNAVRKRRGSLLVWIDPTMQWYANSPNGRAGRDRSTYSAPSRRALSESMNPRKNPRSVERKRLAQPEGCQASSLLIQPERVQPEISEYRLYRGVCAGCHKAHAAKLPAGVTQGQLGPRVLGAIGVLSTQYHLTVAKVQGVLRQFLGLEFSLGTISNAQGLISQALKAPVSQAQAQVRNAAVVHLDETRYPCQGLKQNYAWVAVEPQVVSLSILPTRARIGAESLLGLEPKAVVVSDRYAVYDYVPDAQHQVCWAHLVRDFERIAQRSGAAGGIGKRLVTLSWAVFDWHKRGKTAVQYEPIKRRIKTLLEQAQQCGCKRTARTASNLLGQWATLWLFTTRADVAPTNNAAERAIRTLVLKRKISGLARSRRGLEFVARGYSVVQSCALQGRSALGFMTDSIRHWLGQAVAATRLRPAAATG